MPFGKTTMTAQIVSTADVYKRQSYNHGEASIFDLINYDILDVLIIMPEAIKRDSISNEISKRAHEQIPERISLGR